MSDNDIPRRTRIDQMTPAELEILHAVRVVEDLPADPRLTEAVMLLGQARERVADFVDRLVREQPLPIDRLDTDEESRRRAQRGVERPRPVEHAGPVVCALRERIAVLEDQLETARLQQAAGEAFGVDPVSQTAVVEAGHVVSSALIVKHAYRHPGYEHTMAVTGSGGSIQMILNTVTHGPVPLNLHEGDLITIEVRRPQRAGVSARDLRQP